ncbi:hypothetical protein [Streptomyces sp. NPDC056883]|uniref:hypothetical protein n=1 Tax=Streptomyces sp. NPDC056883 TaxID=3345959 RepID=UPI0036CCC696
MQLAALPNAPRCGIAADTLEGARNLLKRNCSVPAARLTFHAQYAEHLLSVAERWWAKKPTGSWGPQTAPGSGGLPGPASEPLPGRPCRRTPR